MAADPKARLMTVTYPKGSMTATVGLVEYLLGVQNLRWSAASLPALPGGRRRRKYGTKQRATAIGGREIKLKVAAGGTWTVRVTGADIDFLDYILTRADGSKVLQAYTARGTLYGPQFPAVV